MSTRKSARAPTTSQRTLLGLLSLQSWTAYELTRQMRVAVGWVWPRSEASLYTDMKRLVPAGLAEADEEEVGDRTRTRYEVTEAGRDEVTRWLRETEVSEPRVQIEAVLRVFLADLADADDLRRTLDDTRRQVTQQLAAVLPILEDYAAGGGAFPERAHLNALFMHYAAGFFGHVLEWCDDVEAELGTWPDTAGVGMTDGAQRMIDDAIAMHRRAVERHLETSDEEDAP